MALQEQKHSLESSHDWASGKGYAQSWGVWEEGQRLCVGRGLLASPVATHLPDVRGLAHGSLLNDLRGYKLWGAILAVLWLYWGDFLGKAEVADFNVLPSRMHHQDIWGL